MKKKIFSWRTLALVEIIVIWYLISIMPDYMNLFNF